MSTLKITTAGINYKDAVFAGAEVQNITKFVFANVPNLLDTDPIDDNAVVPVANVVHEQPVELVSRLDDNAVVMSVAMGYDIGPFDFNWFGAIAKLADNSEILIAVVHTTLQAKTKTEGPNTGNYSVKSIVWRSNSIAASLNVNLAVLPWQVNDNEFVTKADFDSYSNGIVGVSVLHEGQTVKYGLLPKNGDLFNADDFPRLAEEFPSLVLPIGSDNEYIVSGVNKIAATSDIIVNGSDQAGTWNALPQYLNSGAASNLKTARGDGKGVFVALFESGFAARSIDNGVTWSPLTRGLNCGSITASPFSIETDGNGVWVAVYSNGYAARSIDNGATWSALPQYLNSNGLNSIYSLATDGLGNWVAGFHSGGAARSTDNGATWAVLSSLSDLAGANIINSIAASPTGVWIALWQGGYAARSTDNGATWIALTRGLNNGSSTATHRGLATDAKGAWIAQADGGYSSRSNDDGVSWTALPSNLNTASGSSQSEGIETDKNGLWLATYYDGYLARSIDNGITWTALPRYVSSGASGACYVAIPNGDVWLAGFAGGYAAIAAGTTNTTIKEWGIPA